MVAVSGGRDSMGLLALLHTAGCWNLIVGHVDHRMREGSSEDGLFVEEACAGLGIPCLRLTLDIAPSGETEARKARYALLAQSARTAGAHYVAVAHHRRDQLETRLMNLLRGVSPLGLLGMRSSRPLDGDLHLIRPALLCDPSFLHEAAPAWREDPTNLTGLSPRHKIRNQILPLVEELFPVKTGEALERLARLLSEDESLLQTMVPEAQVLSLEDFRHLPRSLQRRWLRGSLVLGFDQVEAAVDGVVSSRTLDAGAGLTLHVEGGIVSRRVQPAVQ